MISAKKTIIQVVVPKSVKTYIEKYISLFGGSISSFCSSAISDRIIKNDCFENVLLNLDEDKKNVEKDCNSSDVCCFVSLCDKTYG